MNIRRYVRIFINKKGIIIFVISAILANTNILYLSKQYNNFYKFDDKEVEFIATIVSEVEEKEYTNACQIKLSGSKKVILYVKKDSNNIKLNYGNVIKVKGEYEKPRARSNYKGFDYSVYLKSKNIYGSITTNSYNIEILDEQKGDFIAILCNKIKQKFIIQSNKLLPEKSSALLNGIILGEKSNIPEDITENFSKSSLSHILAVSGSHTSYIIIGSVYILQKLNIRKRKTYFATILILIMFMVITGCTASVTRACIMGTIILMSKILYRRVDFWNSISLSILIILLVNPFSITDVGLQLSYGGVLGIAIFNKNISKILAKMKINKKIIDLISITISAEILLIPIIMINFNTLSFTFVLSNLLAIPLLGIIIIVGFIMIIISFVFINCAKVIAIFLNVFLEELIFISYICSKLPLSNITVVTPYLISIFIYYFIIFSSNYIYSLYMLNSLRKYQQLILSNINKRRIIKVIFSIIVIANIIFITYKIIPKKLQIHFIDVGQRR